jgi:DNA-binding MarR family transcriptional regulator
VLNLGRRLKAERAADARPALELSVLGHLHRRGPLTPGDLAVAERVQPQTLTRTLTSLENSGLLSRAAHPHDGRRALLALTEAGLQALRTDMAASDGWLATAMERCLTGTERELLRLASELLDKLSEQASESGQVPTARNR